MKSSLLYRQRRAAAGAAVAAAPAPVIGGREGAPGSGPGRGRSGEGVARPGPSPAPRRRAEKHAARLLAALRPVRWSGSGGNSRPGPRLLPGAPTQPRGESCRRARPR